MQKINFTTDMAAVKSSELVVEAVVENLDLKRKLFKDLEAVSSMINDGSTFYSVHLSKTTLDLCIYFLNVGNFRLNHFSFKYIVIANFRYSSKFWPKG